MAFAGMVGKVLSRQLLKQQVKANEKNLAGKAARLAVGGSGKYLFVPHPNCCPNCNKLGLSPHFYNTPDVAFITHPNCKCATIEAPAGLTPTELLEWAKNPVGPMRFGFNYGVALRTINLTDRNRATTMRNFTNRMMPVPEGQRTTRLIRAKVTQAQIDKVREAVKNGELGPAKNLTGSIKAGATRAMKKSLQALKEKMEGRNIPVRTAVPKARKTAIPQLRNNGTTSWIPKPIVKKVGGRKRKIDVQELNRRFRGNTTVIQRNKRGSGFSAGSFARGKMNDERKTRKERERLLRERGFI